MRISDAKAPGCTNSMLFPGGRTGGLNGAYMCRIIRQARNQSPGMPPSSSLPPSEIPVSPNRRTQSFCLQITGRTPALSTVPGAHSHLFVLPPLVSFFFFFFCPWKRKGTCSRRGGGWWADWRRRKGTVVCKDFSLGSLLWMQVQSFSGLFFWSLLFVFRGGDEG